MAELNIRLDIRFGQSALRLLMVAGMMFSTVSEVASENVTLTTYYPAPSGVYTQMITTGNTFLARDNGKVGVGTPSPGQELDVAVPAGGTTANIRASGELISTMSDGSALGQLRMIAGNYGAFFRNDGADTYFLLTTSGNQYAGWNTLRPFRVNDASGDVYLNGASLYVRASDGHVGIGTTTPGLPLDVNGQVRVSQNITLGNNPPPGTGNYLYGNVACTAMVNATNGACLLTQYATWAPGIYVDNNFWHTGPKVGFNNDEGGNVIKENGVTIGTPTFYCCEL
ncbi:MAG: hypothetical protein ACHQ2Z_00965 [Elusimicrobiota bacterium]